MHMQCIALAVKLAVRTEIRRKFFSVRVISVWNSLSPDTDTSDTLNKFAEQVLGPLAWRPWL